MTEVQDRAAQRFQIGALLLSLVFVIGAMLWTWQIGMAANRLDHRLEHASEDVQELQQAIKQLEAKRA